MVIAQEAGGARRRVWLQSELKINEELVSASLCFRDQSVSVDIDHKRVSAQALTDLAESLEGLGFVSPYFVAQLSALVELELC